jgi:adenylate kinase
VASFSTDFPERVVCILVEENALVGRLVRRAELEDRGDDTPETIRHRMQVYGDNTQPLVDYYRGQGVLVEVEGGGSIDEVAKRIEEALAS